MTLRDSLQEWYNDKMAGLETQTKWADKTFSDETRAFDVFFRERFMRVIEAKQEVLTALQIEFELEPKT